MKNLIIISTILTSFTVHAVMETHVYNITLKSAEGKNKESCGFGGELEIITSDCLPLEAKFILLDSIGSAAVFKFDLSNGNFRTISDSKHTYGGGANGEGDNITHSLKRTITQFIELDGVFSAKTEIAENQITKEDLNNPNPKLGKFIYTEKTLDKTDLSAILDFNGDGEVSIQKDSTTKTYSGFLNFSEKFNFDCVFTATRD
jgi:hypothetical protein